MRAAELVTFFSSCALRSDDTEEKLRSIRPTRPRAADRVDGYTASDYESTWRFLTDRRDAPILVRIKTARSTTFTP